LITGGSKETEAAILKPVEGRTLNKNSFCYEKIPGWNTELTPSLDTTKAPNWVIEITLTWVIERFFV